jgi:hypothetical protein
MAKENKQEDFLKQHGFKKKWCSDKSGNWMQLKIKHKMFTDLLITVEEDTICLNCRDVVQLSVIDPVFLKCKYSEKKIIEILSWLRK